MFEFSTIIIFYLEFWGEVGKAQKNSCLTLNGRDGIQTQAFWLQNQTTVQHCVQVSKIWRAKNVKFISAQTLNYQPIVKLNSPPLTKFGWINHSLDCVQILCSQPCPGSPTSELQPRFCDLSLSIAVARKQKRIFIIVISIKSCEQLMAVMIQYLGKTINIYDIKEYLCYRIIDLSLICGFVISDLNFLTHIMKRFT